MISDTPVTTDTIIIILTIVGTMSSVLFSIQSSQSFFKVYKSKPEQKEYGFDWIEPCFIYDSLWVMTI